MSQRGLVSMDEMPATPPVELDSNLVLRKLVENNSDSHETGVQP